MCINLLSSGKREAYYKSDAVLKVLEQLGLPLYAASAVGSTLPLFIRNGMYNEVAANRYRCVYVDLYICLYKCIFIDV
jgi:predicted DCC family thiol-disulfide oxidoreductase YuxK